MQDAGTGASAYRRGAAPSRFDDASPSRGEQEALKPQQLALGDDEALADLEDEATTPARFAQLALYATACLMCSFDWNIMVRARLPRRRRHRSARGLNCPARASRHRLRRRRPSTPSASSASTWGCNASTRCQTCARARVSQAASYACVGR